MKTLTRNTLFAFTLLSSLLISPAMAGGDWRFDHAGGWRTHGGGHGHSDDKPVHSLHDCKSLCENDTNCKGVEFRTHHDGHTQSHVCEVHHDDYSHCDTSHGSGTRLSPDDGCHVFNRHHDSEAPQETHGKGHDGKCYAWNWDKIKIGHWGDHQGEVFPRHAHGGLVVDIDPWFLRINPEYSVTTHHDCTISLKSHHNHKYVSTWDNNHYELRADGNEIGSEDQYKVYRHADGNYLFKSVKYGSWVYVEHGNAQLKANPTANSKWSDRKFNISISAVK